MVDRNPAPGPLPAEVGRCLDAGLAQLGVPDSAGRAAALVRYLELLQRWNRAYNLTSVTEPRDMAVRHILDSVSARPFLAGARVLDAGSGAGLPGIPLALLEPARHFTLLDSVGKKVSFLRQAVLELRLANATPVQARLENWDAALAFDTVICRALGTLTAFASLCGRLLAPGGRLVAMKGRFPREELDELPRPWRVVEARRVTVPGLEAERHFVVLEHGSDG
ncbi:MAG: 16S rRNA (guanine(527)-N(7))-methyltransferase RsmG [Gammaproteobacteria bacterium]|nr:MAG: 16S rRNA (guanine(527)-N(7))-methyltransferase RsmG [Gammaproteobacteria bacterium]